MPLKFDNDNDPRHGPTAPQSEQEMEYILVRELLEGINESNPPDPDEAIARNDLAALKRVAEKRRKPHAT